MQSMPKLMAHSKAVIRLKFKASEALEKQNKTKTKNKTNKRYISTKEWIMKKWDM